MEKTCEVPEWTAPRTLSHPPRVMWLHERYCPQAGRVRRSARLLCLGLSGRVGRRKRGAVRGHPPARGRANRHTLVASA